MASINGTHCRMAAANFASAMNAKKADTCAFAIVVQVRSRLKTAKVGVLRHRGWQFTSSRLRRVPRVLDSDRHRARMTIPPPSDIGDVSVILLAGGTGSRMKADRPKQFLELAGKTVVEHSLMLFGLMPEVKQLILVLDKSYRDQFLKYRNMLDCELAFADPGNERQDSVYNGLCAVSEGANLVCVHDSARPLVSEENIRDVLRDGAEYGAAVLGVPSKATIKESADGRFVLRTIPRQRLWEIQTPQVIRPGLLLQGFEKVRRENLAVTDDVSIIEQLGEQVKITLGEYTNIKLTTPEDMDIAEAILRERSKSGVAS
ncbi:2-C-methyl-D-erythritol 4-phosphate cytidylyltransferase, chloroplastic [Gracilariopsis chorda]|uniref:2-C-methyl-D-erythritol 4-phosphate cytidylyltransferase, chloroplastic n=1 Tax=Gracilariopsis chorda TaxID=448386 RepID=A0A2V3IX23_9FLOR|nr:2-C-methyl-D-erythritol 4-phosphate cytidylyltransferase, chloroplastic [Gracilariopsis chorda]|eukprot:PXF46698.1 2-C-methyl-D-erythritol 4-phosphate cytidylyltransferase, chloroplastic [Gracilariopsis chorda]